MKKRVLTKDKVILKAVELIDQLPANHPLALKSLAAALNIKTPSLYNHIKNQDDLLIELAIWGNLQLHENIHREIGGKFGTDALITIAHIYRRFANQHPGVYRLMNRAPLPDQKRLEESSNALKNTVGLALSGLSIKEEELAYTIFAFRSGIHGFVSLEIEEGFDNPIDLEKSFERLLKLYTQGVLHLY